MMTYCYNDVYSWGRELHASIEKHKGSAQMFTHALQVPDEPGVHTFLNITDKERDYVKELNEELGSKQQICQIPSLGEGRLHDERLPQYQLFGPWMPTTWLLTSITEVSRQLNALVYPIVSVSSARAWQNRRLLENPDEAFQDAVLAFSLHGKCLVTGGHQKDYVLWQPVVDRGHGRWAVFMAAKRYAAVTRLLGDGNPSDPQLPIEPIDVLDERIVEVLKYTAAFVREYNLNWVSVEVLAGLDPVRKIASPFVMEVATSWPFAWFRRGGMIFESDNGLDWTSTGLPSSRVFDVLATSILEGRFNA